MTDYVKNAVQEYSIIDGVDLDQDGYIRETKPTKKSAVLVCFSMLLVPTKLT